MSDVLPGWAVDSLRNCGLLSVDEPTGEPLTGGVSSDIWRADLPGGAVCIKRALPQLRVAAEWHAPVERSRWEADWLRRASSVEPNGVCRVLAEDSAAGVVVLEWLEPSQHTNWKMELAAGRVDAAVAATVGRRLGVLHQASAEWASAFEPAKPLFHALRIDPYLYEIARRHPEISDCIHDLAGGLGARSTAVIHGDLSPKNIMVGPKGPVFLDAECASAGDPAFDVAFCLNHLRLKSVWKPKASPALANASVALVEAYRQHVEWEPWTALDARIGALLPALALARVDGLSPVEYLDDDERARVRADALAALAAAPEPATDQLARWAGESSEE